MGGTRDHGLVIGRLDPGPRNAITDVAGVSVGHVTLSDGPIQTGCTAVRLHPGHPFREKLSAGAHVINGFGKSVGLVQVDKLGTIESPVVLTNTLAVGTASSALVRHLLEITPEIGETTGTVNPVVMECNDGSWLNDIRGLHVREDHVFTSLARASADFDQGNIGAGTGMSCYGLAGGIGSASRRVSISDSRYTLGVLALCNMGRLDDLVVNGRPVGARLRAQLSAEILKDTPEAGSIIVLVATDAPVDGRQLRRIARRVQAGIARTGSQFGNGSGDIALAVSTAEPVPHAAPVGAHLDRRLLHETAIDPLFQATVESTEEAILNALFRARPRTGKHGNARRALSEFLGEPDLIQPGHF